MKKDRVYKLTPKDLNTDDQTIMFWNLQLNFLEMSPVTVLDQLVDISSSGIKLSKKAMKHAEMLKNQGIVPPKRDEYYLITELALYLSGLK